MAEIRRFEDIAAWQKGRELARLVYRASSGSRLGRDAALRGQMRRAAVSVVANIAEGFERDGDKEFRQFLSVAKGSTGELRAHLYVAFDAGLIPREQFDQLHALAMETSWLIAGLMRYFGGSQMGGIKFRRDSPLHAETYELAPHL